MPGMEVMAAPTNRKAPASPMFAAVPAVAAAAWVVVAAALAAAAVVLAVVAAVLVLLAAVFAVVAAVSAIWAIVAFAFTVFHHSCNPFNVTSRKALSLLRVLATCWRPIVIPMSDCTRNIIFWRFSFSPLKRATAPCAAEKAPVNPETPAITPWSPALSCDRILACVLASRSALVRRAASSLNLV